MVLKHQFVSRLGLFVSVLVLAGACGGGEIGNAPGGSRRGPEASDPEVGPEASDPEVGNEVSPLVCPGASPDVSASNGWYSSEASLPADGALRFEFKARPTAASLDGVVAVGAEDIDDFGKAAITLRFADNGLVDVRDGAFYSSDLAYPYDPGVWYSIAISADIDAKTYDVEIGPCGEPRQSLIEDATFRDDADVQGQLATWGVWSSQAAPLEVSTPTWTTSEGCTPATCLSLGHACGTPQDGCGGVLSCGVCGDGEMCSSGTCIDAPANASPPRDPPAPGTPYGHVVPSDVGNTIGVGVVAAVPTTPYTGPATITVPGTTIENVTISDCLAIQADNVTLRNVIISCSFWWTVTILNADNVTIEYSTLNNTQALGAKGFRVAEASNLIIRKNELSGGEDFFYSDGYMDEVYIEDNYFHSLVGDNENSHSDGFQLWGTTGGNVYIRGNYFQPNNLLIPKTDLLFLNATNRAFFENNFIDGVWGYYTLRPNNLGGTVMQHNIYGQIFKTELPAPGLPTDALIIGSQQAVLSTYRCNRYEDGDFIEQQYINGPLTHEITGCPSYPPPP